MKCNMSQARIVGQPSLTYDVECLSYNGSCRDPFYRFMVIFHNLNNTIHHYQSSLCIPRGSQDHMATGIFGHLHVFISQLRLECLTGLHILHSPLSLSFTWALSLSLAVWLAFLHHWRRNTFVPYSVSILIYICGI